MTTHVGGQGEPIGIVQEIKLDQKNKWYILTQQKIRHTNYSGIVT